MVGFIVVSVRSSRSGRRRFVALVIFVPPPRIVSLCHHLLRVVAVITKRSLQFITTLPLPLRWAIVVARVLLIIVTESTVAELPVVDNGLVSGVEAGVIGVEDEVRNKVDELVVVDEELVKLVELIGVVLDVDELEVCRELEIEEDNELEAIKLESEETCGEEEGLGNGVEEVPPKGKYAAESGTITQRGDNEHDSTKEGA
ncbi:hypothetical protein EDB89DRAFT_2068381 [Lactarius sanguifluus]|nr:hypothetical protein EDB89DRAFT_2068381 [Lactarius sanguifluus]